MVLEITGLGFFILFGSGEVTIEGAPFAHFGVNSPGFCCRRFDSMFASVFEVISNSQRVIIWYRCVCSLVSYFDGFTGDLDLLSLAAAQLMGSVVFITGLSV